MPALRCIQSVGFARPPAGGSMACVQSPGWGEAPTGLDGNLGSAPSRPTDRSVPQFLRVLNRELDSTSGSETEAVTRPARNCSGSEFRTGGKESGPNPGGTSGCQNLTVSGSVPSGVTLTLERAGGRGERAEIRGYEKTPPYKVRS